MDASTTPKTLRVNIGKTPHAAGVIDETFLLTHTGSVSFPDENDKKYPFWYYPTEGKLYWSKEKGKGVVGDWWIGETDENSKSQNVIPLLMDKYCISKCMIEIVRIRPRKIYIFPM